MQDGVWDCSGVGFEGFEDEEEAFVVGCCEGGEGCYFLQGLIVFDVSEFEGAHKRSQSLSAKSVCRQHKNNHMSKGSPPKWFLLNEGIFLEVLEERGWRFGYHM